MQDAVVALIDLHSGTQHRSVVGMLNGERRLRVGSRGQQQTHIDAAACGTLQGLALLMGGALAVYTILRNRTMGRAPVAKQ